MKKIWNSQSVGVKVALISGFFVLITGFCAIISALIAIYPDLRNMNSKVSQTSTAEIATQSTPSLVVDKAGAYSSWELQAQIDDQLIYLVPSKCLMFSNQTHSLNLDNISLMEANSSFLVISHEAAILVDMKVVLDNYVLPDYSKSYTDIEVDLGQYGGGVNAINLGAVTISPSFTEASLTPQSAFQLEDQDALRFYFTTTFTEPGQYKYHVIVEARTMSGKHLSLESNKIDFYWMQVDDLLAKNVIDSSTESNAEIARCP